MADDIDLRKCSEFNDGHFDMLQDQFAFSIISECGKNRAFDAEI